MAEILHHQLYVIYETSGCFPYELLNFKIGSTWEVVQDFSYSEFQMFHVLDHHNVKIEGVQRNKSWSKVVQDFRHQQYHNIHDIKMCDFMRVKGHGFYTDACQVDHMSSVAMVRECAWVSAQMPDVHLGADVPEKYCIQMWQMCKNIGNASEIINNQHILILIQPYS